MAGFTNYLEEKLLEHTFDKTAYTSPTAVYLGLLSTAPTDSSSGTELSGNGYSRQECDFDAYSAGAVKNTNSESFTASGGDWSTVVAFGIYDASSGGNLLAYGDILPSVTVTDGETFTVDAGKIEITLD